MLKLDRTLTSSPKLKYVTLLGAMKVAHNAMSHEFCNYNSRLKKMNFPKRLHPLSWTPWIGLDFIDFIISL